MSHHWSSIGKKAICVSGGSGCWTARFLEPVESESHDKTLIAATKEINEILEGVSKDKEGRELAILDSKFGVVLSWVTHEDPKERVVTSADDDETVKRTLGLC